MNKTLWFLLSFFTLYLISNPSWALNLKTGKKIYKKNCKECHGRSGKGNGLEAWFRRLKTPDFTDPKTMSEVTDEDMEKIIKKGGKAVGKSNKMEAYGKKLTDQQIQEVIAYIRSFRKE